MKKLLKALLIVFLLGLFFSFGFFTKVILDVDILCGDPVPARTTKALKFNGLTLNKGAIIPIRMCEYANRFTLEFWLPNKLEKDDFEIIGVPHGKDINYAGGGSVE